eukprot:4039132-Pleurochrysis_carterae.AAC.2
MRGDGAAARGTHAEAGGRWPRSAASPRRGLAPVATRAEMWSVRGDRSRPRGGDARKRGGRRALTGDRHIG